MGWDGEMRFSWLENDGSRRSGGEVVEDLDFEGAGRQCGE